jgi:4-amino-4-deoxy-L-arabinose transferase-like glycosyltransferase
MSHRRRPSFLTLAILMAIVLVGAVLRFYELGTSPPGLYHDEAFNGQDALGVLAGKHPIFFEGNNGREPLFLYLMALGMAIWGRTPFAVRVAAALLGTLTVPATFLMARAWFNVRVGLSSAALIAVAPWPINLSRIGLRAVSMPFITALALWLWWAGRRQQGLRRMLLLVLGGLLLGLSLYTYTAARFALVAVVGFALFQAWVSKERFDRSEWAYLLLPAVVAMVPLIGYGVTNWEAFAERTAQVSIWNPAINNGDPLGMLARNVLRAAGLFAYRGDAIPRHNVPLRPLFDPVVSVFWLLGVLLSLGKVRRSGAHALALIWTGVLLVPTILAEDCPHFLRAVGVLPVAAVFPALGLEWMRGHLARVGRSHLGHLAVGGVLIISGLWGTYDYFVRHAGAAEELGYYFEADQLREAAEINRFLGTGWQGEGIGEPRGTPVPGRQVYLGPRLWENRIAVNLLVASPERVAILGRDRPVEADHVLALVWPFEDMAVVRQVLPSPAEIAVWPGPMEKGDLDAVPRLLYVAFQGDRLDSASPAIARFEGGLELLDWRASATEDGLTQLDLRWRTTRPLSKDYTVFVHVERDGTTVAQDDRAPGAGYYPTSWWRPGDEITDTHVLDAPYDPTGHRVWVGWYELSSMQHLRVLDRNAQPGQEQLALQ